MSDILPIREDCENPEVSVIIPTFNRASSIRAAVESVLRQTFRNFEIIIVDDGSSDDTLISLADVKDPRVRIIQHRTNLGVSAARNTGIIKSRGHWIAFQDSDDEWFPLKLEKQMRRMSACNTSACYCSLLSFTPSKAEGRLGATSARITPGQDIYPLEGDISISLLKNNFISTQTLIVERSIIDSLEGFDTNLHALEDWDLVIRIAEITSFSFVDEPLVLQHFSANSITLDVEKWPRARERLIEKHRRIFSNHAPYLIQHYRATSSQFRRLGLFDDALRSINAARKVQPFSPLLFIIFLFTYAMRAIKFQN